MKFTTIAALASLSLSKVALADSPEFALLIIHSGSRIQNSSPALDGNKLVVNGEEGQISVVTDDGKLKYGKQYITVDSNNELVVVDDASKAVSGFSIADGRLVFSKDFYASPIAGKDAYSLFAGTLNVAEVIPFVFDAFDKDGHRLTDFTPGKKPAPTSSAQVITQTENGASNNAVGLGGVVAVAAAMLL